MVLMCLLRRMWLVFLIVITIYEIFIWTFIPPLIRCTYFHGYSTFNDGISLVSLIFVVLYMVIKRIAF
jgi:hypothetical protein